MSEYDDTNRGSIWPNKRKETDSHPDFTGSLNVQGTDYWVSAWKRRPEDNPAGPSLKFSIREKEPRQEVPPAEAAKDGEFRDDDIPF